jgi:hypothetical protein
MATIEELERRLAALEECLGMEAGLRASQDRDLASLAAGQRAANHLLQALSITQGEHTLALERHTEVLGTIQSGIQEILRLLSQAETTHNAAGAGNLIRSAQAAGSCSWMSVRRFRRRMSSRARPGAQTTVSSSRRGFLGVVPTTS